MEDFAHALADFVRDHQAWAAPIVLVLAFGESLAFISLLIPAWGALVAIGALIGASGIPRIWLNLGHGSSGWALSCGSARAVADLMAGHTPEVDIEGLGIERLAA